METKKLVVEVTQEDIDLGCKGDSGNCPIARAIVRQGYAAAVYNSIVIWDDVTKAFYGAPTPAVAQRFIDAFDSSNYRREGILPLTFEVELTEKTESEVRRLFHAFDEKKHAYNYKCNVRAA